MLSSTDLGKAVLQPEAQIRKSLRGQRECLPWLGTSSVEEPTTSFRVSRSSSTAVTILEARHVRERYLQHAYPWPHSRTRTEYVSTFSIQSSIIEISLLCTRCPDPRGYQYITTLNRQSRELAVLKTLILPLPIHLADPNYLDHRVSC